MHDIHSHSGPRGRPLSDRSEVLLSFDEVTKVYGSGVDAVTAVESIDIDVEQGEFVSFVGPSGCGKTTLLHTAAGLLEPTDGSVRVDGVDTQHPTFEKHNVGLVFQDAVLLEWRTVLKNVLLPIEIMDENGVLDEPRDHYEKRAQDLLELVGLEGFGDAYPTELSGGMQQRASICRSLVYDPPVLLMDEPFAALDKFTRDQMNTELLDIWRKTEKTILFITHNLEEAIFLSDRVVVLSARPGRVVDVIDVDIGRPRTMDVRSTSEYRDYVTEIQEHFVDPQ